MPRAAADDRDAEVVDVVEQRRRPDQRVEILRVPDVARVHDDEPAVEAVLPRPRVVARRRRERVRVDPVRDHRHAIGARALRHEPLAHRLADRDDAVGAAQVRVARARATTARTTRFSIRPSCDRRLREHVLRHDDERHAEAARDDQREVADHRRVRHREHDVGPLLRERDAQRLGEERRVVQRAQPQPAPLERGRAHADDLDAVAHLAAGAAHSRSVARDDRHVEVARELAAQLREQLPGRLDARRVVLVEDEQPRRRPRHARRTTRLPSTSTSMRVFWNVSTACSGVITIGSFSLNDVLSRIGTPVCRSNSSISR